MNLRDVWHTINHFTISKSRVKEGQEKVKGSRKIIEENTKKIIHKPITINLSC